MGIRHGKSCHVGTHQTFLNIDQLCNGQEVDYFLDKTDNHNKTMITVTNGFGGPAAVSNAAVYPPVQCEMQLIVNGKPVGPRIPFGRSFSVQKEDVRHIAIRCFEPMQKTVTKTKTVTRTVTKTVTYPTKVDLDLIHDGYGGTDTCTGTLMINKTFCICCND